MSGSDSLSPQVGNFPRLRQGLPLVIGSKSVNWVYTRSILQYWSTFGLMPGRYLELFIPTDTPTVIRPIILRCFRSLK